MMKNTEINFDGTNYSYTFKKNSTLLQIVGNAYSDKCRFGEEIDGNIEWRSWDYECGIICDGEGHVRNDESIETLANEMMVNA